MGSEPHEREHPPGSTHPAARERVPVEQLVDLDALGSDGRRPSPAAIRAALPPGWVLYTQGIGFDNAGTWLGTRSLRVTWP